MNNMTIVYILAALLLLFLAIVWVVYYMCFFQSRRQRKTWRDTDFTGSYAPYMERVKELIAKLEATDFEPVQCMSEDGLILTGRYYHLSDHAPLDIMVHGYRSCSSIDFCGGFQMARELNHNVLLIDQRACGGSEGRSITFGIKERRDLLNWITYAICRFGEDVEINLFGVSMGAATVLMINDLELPGNVKRIIADSPYDVPKDIIMKVARNMGFPDAVWPLIWLAARLCCRIDITESSALDGVRRCKVPLLIFHGEADQLVPCEMSRTLYEAAPEGTRLVTVPGADHVASMLADRETYRAAVWEFMGK